MSTIPGQAAYAAYHASSRHPAGPFTAGLAQHWNAAATAATEACRLGEFHRAALAFLSTLRAVLPDVPDSSHVLKAAEEVTAGAAQLMAGGTLPEALKSCTLPVMQPDETL